MNSLHFSFFNTVNVPLTFCKVYEAMGHSGRLLTLYKHRGNIPEDICLHKKLFDPWWLKKYRAMREKKSEQAIPLAVHRGIPVDFSPSNPVTRCFFALRDNFREFEFKKLADTYKLYDFDVYHFHGGIDFFRDSRWVKKLAAMGKPVICHYHGPDIRTRGIVKAVDNVSSLNLTSEFDLLALHTNLKYLAIPFDCSFLFAKANTGKKIRIIHTPSNPAAKGTHLIEPVLQQIKKIRDIEFVILTGVSHQKILEAKMQSDIAIEQIGNFGGTGYGVNSLETLAMNIPTVTEFTPDYETFMKDHPFVLANKDTLFDALLKLIDDEAYRMEIGSKGREWVIKTHSYQGVWNSMFDYMKEAIPQVAEKLEE